MESMTDARLNSGRSSGESPIPDQSTYQDRPDLKDLASELLEFPKIRTMLANHTRFFLSREMANAVQPQIPIEDVERILDLAGEWAQDDPVFKNKYWQFLRRTFGPIETVRD